MNDWGFARWRWRHPRLARLIPHRVTSWLIWREALADPAFVASMEQGQRDLDEGRKVPWDVVRSTLDPAVDAIAEEKP